MLSSEYLTAEEEEERLERARRAVEEKLEEKLEDKPTTRLWGLFRDARDIAERHVISKLNETDVKFFYDVNSETRELIKRATATRSGMKLAEKFKIEEMSSISTLEFALENRSLWPSKWDEKCFCAQVARTNKLELLKWIREEKKCEWDDRTITKAAIQGNLDMIKYCVANKCPMDESSCARAACNGHLECLKCLHEEGNAPWHSFTAAWAALKGHLHILEYLVERKYDEYQENACAYAPWYGHLDCLKYLRETAKAPWDSHAVRRAHKYDRLECLQYLLDNDCPLPRGWRYEHGTLHTD